MSGVRGLDLVRHMQYFLAVADELHFGRASELLGMSQPPLSQGIRRLEARVGGPLFEREPRVTLTPAGAALVPRARRLVRLAAEVLDELPAGRATIAVGVVPQLPVSVVTSLVSAIRAADANRVVTTRVGASSELLRDVRAERLDVAVVEHPSVLDPVPAASAVVRLPRWLLVPADHPLAGRRSVDRAALLGCEIAIGHRAGNAAAHDALSDSLGAVGAVVSDLAADDDRQALLVAASGRAAAFTCDPHAAATGCRRIMLREDPYPLRVRVVAASGATALIDALVPDVVRAPR